MASIVRGFAEAGAAALIAMTTLSVASAGPQLPARTQAPPLRPAPGPCDRYGAGYVKIEGSDTCIKTGASVQSDAYSSSTTRSSGGAIAPALRSQ